MFVDGEFQDEFLIHHFTLLLGIVLTGSNVKFSGNFGYSPGSHEKMENIVKNNPFGNIILR
jgi:hypothetical protein